MACSLRETMYRRRWGRNASLACDIVHVLSVAYLVPLKRKHAVRHASAVSVDNLAHTSRTRCPPAYVCYQKFFY